jgi:hypothetical protein
MSDRPHAGGKIEALGFRDGRRRNMRMAVASLAIVAFSTLAFAGPLEDIRAANETSASLAAGDLRGAEERMRRIEDPNLRQVWGANVMARHLEAGNLDDAERLLAVLNDPNLRQVWSANIVARALNGGGECPRARRLVDGFVDPSLKAVWQANVALRC